MTINYPTTLPDFKMGKQRSQQQTFRTSQPFNGPLYIEKITDESPVAWNVTIDCRNQIQARQVQAFLRAVNDGQPFIKKILTEEGYIEHEVRFIEMPLQPTQKNQFLWSYSGVIYAAVLNQPDALIDDSLIYEWLQDAGIIDNALNNLWPDNGVITQPLTWLLGIDGQLVKNLAGALTWARSTTASYIDHNSGLVKYAAINEPRFDGLGWLVEGASTNLCIRSEEFDNAPWGVTGGFTGEAKVIGPDGSLSATAFRENGNNSEHFFAQTVASSASATVTTSTFVKLGASGAARSLRIRAADSGGFVASVFFNLTSESTYGVTVGATASIEKLGDGWFKCDVTWGTTQSNLVVGIYLVEEGQTVTTYAGNSTSGLQIWGAQLESLPFATSYIKTTVAAATRTREDVSCQGEGNIPLPDKNLTASMRLSNFGVGTDRRVFGADDFDFFYGVLKANDTFLLSNGASTISPVGNVEECSIIYTQDVDTPTRKSYLNGGSSGTTSTAYATINATPPEKIVLGNSAHTYSISQAFYGRISDFKIYDIPLTQEQIESGDY